MQLPPIRRPQPGDTQVSATMLNNLISRVQRLETLHANSPIKLENTRAGMCLSLNTDIQTFRLAIAEEIHNGGVSESSVCHIAQWNATTETFELDEKQEIQVYDPFGVGFWPNQLIFVTKYYDSGIWIHMPMQDKELYGITQAALEPCSTVSVERIVDGALSGEFYNAYNPHDWNAPEGILIQSKYVKQFDQYTIYAADCEASCLGL